MLKFIKNNLDKVRDQFEEGGKFQRFYPLFEATDTILFSTLTKKQTLVRILEIVSTQNAL